MPEACATHKRAIGYIAWHLDSERRMKAGQRQRQCQKCARWYWRHEFGVGWSSAIEEAA